MKIILKLIILFILFSIGNLFAEIQVDKKIPYRIYIGKDKTVDWIDVKSTGHLDNKGNYIIDFEDLSPIEWIDYFISAQFYLIQKKDSVWKLYLGATPEETILRRCDYSELAPLNRMLINSKSIYKH